MMGLFPEIGRAWLTIDSDIYVRYLIVYLKSKKSKKILFRFGLTKIHVMLPILMI